MWREGHSYAVCCTVALTLPAGRGSRHQIDRVGQCVAFRVLEGDSGCDVTLPAPQTQAPLLRRGRWNLEVSAFLPHAVRKAWLV